MYVHDFILWSVVSFFLQYPEPSSSFWRYSNPPQPHRFAASLLHLCHHFIANRGKMFIYFWGLCIYITLNLNSILGAQWKEILNLLKSTAYLFWGKIPTYECSSCCIFTFTASWKISLNGFICSCVFLWFPCLFADTCGNVDVGLFCCVVAVKPLAWYPGDTNGPQVEQQWDNRSGFPLISIFMCLFLWLFVLKLSF